MNPEFERLLRHHRIDDLRAHAGSVYGVWPDFRLAYLNPAWFRFAQDNAGEPAISARWGLGASILDAIPPGVREFYETSYRECLRTGNIWTYEYECSSDRVFRLLAQVVYPLGRAGGFLIANSVRVEKDHNSKERMAKPPDDHVYRDQDGFIHQCACCRRVKNLHEPERWDWVPAWVAQIPVATSHTFCPPCFGHYFRFPAG